MRRNLIPLLGIAFVVAVAATGIFYGLFVGKISGATPTAPPQIVVAARDLQSGMILQPEDLRAESWTAPLPDGAIYSKQDATGRGLTERVRAGEPIVHGKVSTVASTASGSVPTGMRGISLRIMDSSGLFPSLRPGMKVDLQVVQMNTESGPAARTLLQNVTFLGLQGEPPQPGSLAVANLLVSPEEADRLALAEAAARIRLLLRNQSEPSSPIRPSTGLAALLKSPPAGTQSPAPAVHSASSNVQVSKLNLNWVLAWIPEQSLRPATLPDPGLRLEVIGKDSQLWRDLGASTSKSAPVSKSLLAGARPELLLQTRGLPTEDVGFNLLAQTQAAADGFRLILQPEVTLPTPGGWSSHHFPKALLLRQGESILLTGLDNEKAFPGLAAKLPMPEGKESGSRLALIISAGATPGQPQFAAAR